MYVTNIAEDMMEIEMITAKIDLEIPICNSWNILKGRKKPLPKENVFIA